VNSIKPKLVIDSSAWIEYFKGSERGKPVIPWVDNPVNDRITLDVCVSEIKYWYLAKGLNFHPIFSVLCEKSTILESSLKDWLVAAELKIEKRRKHPDIGLVDVLQMVHARKLKARILTTDPHFRGEKRVVLF
jgi:predicted nucleic acid-binding protein